IHALDGRFNKAGGYIAATAWWSEGLAEYVSYESPYERFETSLAVEKPTLSDIFQTHNNGYATSPYTWGALAVAFFAQQKPQELTQMLSLMREGQWDEWDGLMVSWAENHQAEFSQWLSTGPRIDFETSAKTLTLGSYELIEGRGGWLYQVEVPEGTDSLTINMTGGSANSGSMDLDLMVSAGQVPHWSFGAAPQCAPYKEGNEETCTFTDITPGTYYITLDEYHSWAADIVDVYLSACTGTDCLVDLPEPKPLVEFVDVVLPIDPLPPAEAEVLAISSCDLVTTYTRSSDAAIVSITNTTDTPVLLYWISNDTGQPYLESAYATLAQGEEYTADYWVIGDRMMLADSSNACLGVADLSTSNNKFVIDESLFGG
ncbi:MAG: collagenase, partial [Psychrosphaera sp.]|nr:collagenase [Psychrosphaera sp.]